MKLSERLERGARVMRDTAQMKTQHPEWLLNEMEQSADLLEEAAAALEAAREDAERLDWLAREASTLWGSRDRGGYELPYFDITSGRECCNPGDLRAAIDQARGKGVQS